MLGTLSSEATRAEPHPNVAMIKRHRNSLILLLSLSVWRLAGSVSLGICSLCRELQTALIERAMKSVENSKRNIAGRTIPIYKANPWAEHLHNVRIIMGFNHFNW